MSKLFHGDWSVEIVEISGLTRRLIIQGSAANDGIYPTAVATAIAVTGAPGIGWQVSTESLRPQPRGSTVEDWRPNDLRPVSADCSLQDGLVVMLSASRMGLTWNGGTLTPLEGHIVLRCRNVEPRLNPWHAVVNPYDLRVVRRRPPPGPVRPPSR